MTTDRAVALPQAGEPVPIYQSVTVEFESIRSFDGEHTGSWQTATPNPFLHCKLDVYFDHAELGQAIRVPGYFAGDGDGAQAGSIWRAHFTPTLTGEWTYFAVLEMGQNLNTAPLGGSGVPQDLVLDFDRIDASPMDPDAPGFGSKGVVAWERSQDYLEFSEPSAGRFVQVGAGSPENFLGYAGFQDARDGRSSQGGLCCCRQACFDDCRRTICENAGDPASNFLHRYEAHISDWRPGDPDWSANGQAQQGRGIIGALNYLGDECGVNAIYVMPMNLGGDGKDTHPFWTDGGALDCPISGGNFDPSHTLNYHVARLDQWRTVLEHANNKGIMVQLVLAEQEACNIRWFGAHDPFGAARSHMSLYRRLYMKQMVAHFGHLPALRWNLCEENKSDASCGSSSSCGTGGTPMTPQFTAEELDRMARWIRSWDAALQHPIGVHTAPNDTRLYADLLDLPSFPAWFGATSLQVHGEAGQGQIYEDSIQETNALFEQYGWNAPIINDEQGSPTNGLSSQFNTDAADASTADDRRKRTLYDVLLSGGQLSYYFGYYGGNKGGGDLRTEDFRTRDDALHQLGFAGKVMTSARIWEMRDADEMIVGNALNSSYGKPEVAATPERDRILVYYALLRGAETGPVRPGRIDLSGQEGLFRCTWISPTEFRKVGIAGPIVGGGERAIPLPDIDGDGVAGNAITTETDLLVLIERILDADPTE